MKYLKRILIILIIFMIIIIGGIICIISVEKNNSELNEENAGDAGESLQVNKSVLENVTDKDRFFTVRNCVQQFLDKINDNNSNYFSTDEEGNQIKILEDNQIKQSRYNMLSSKFIEKNNITVANINNNLKTMNSKVIFDALDIKYLKGERLENYIVYGIVTSLSNEYMGELYIIINLDRENSTFSVEPIYSKCNSIDDIEITYNDNAISKNSDNEYKNQSMTYENIAKEYFSIYKRIVLSKPEIIYNNYLLEEYKVKRFGDIEKFIEYKENNKDEIVKLQMNKYSINNNNDYTEIVCMDQYQNIYVFEETEPMQFKLKLDTYTVISDKFKSTYDSLSEQKKVAMNIDKWVQMLNNRDYINAYAVLDETFKNSNWKSEKEFEKYIKKELPVHYGVKFTTYSNENSTYVQSIEISDITGSTKDVKTLDIIMQLKDNYEFVMSFSIK